MLKNLNLSSLTLTLALSMNVSAAETAQTYLTSSSGLPVVASSGECIETIGGQTAEQLKGCGLENVAQTGKAVIDLKVITKDLNYSITASADKHVELTAKLFFDFNSAELTDSSKYILDERMERFHGNVQSTSNIMIVGHTDSVGPAEYNQQLSEDRANAVADYIRENAYNSDITIKTVGMGEAEPWISNSSEFSRQQNRRVKIHFSGVGS